MFTLQFRPTLYEFFLGTVYLFIPVYIKRLIIYGAFALIALAISYYLQELKFFHYFAIALLAIYLFSLIVDPVVNVLRRKELVSEVFSHDTILTIDDKGLTTWVDEVKNELPWKYVKKFKETNRFIFIYRTRLSGYFIPKRAFSTSAEQHQVIEFINSKIPKA